MQVDVDVESVTSECVHEDTPPLKRHMIARNCNGLSDHPS